MEQGQRVSMEEQQNEASQSHRRSHSPVLLRGRTKGRMDEQKVFLLCF